MTMCTKCYSDYLSEKQFNKMLILTQERRTASLFRSVLGFLPVDPVRYHVHCVIGFDTFRFSIMSYNNIIALSGTCKPNYVCSLRFVL